MSLYTPKEILSYVEKTSFEKRGLNLKKTVILGFIAGAYIAMGGLLSILIGYGFPEISAGNPGLQKFLTGAMFPVGLILVVVAGAELFTSNTAYFTPGALSGKHSLSVVLRSWVTVYASNFAGALFFSYFLIYLTGIVHYDPWHSSIIKLAEAKVSYPFLTVFLKGIGANWLVCLAIWLGISAKDTTGKILGIWWPVMCFVAIGYEHCIANMFYVPLGIFEGANVSWTQFLLNSLLPSTLGNIVGGAFFVGTLYWYVYGRD